MKELQDNLRKARKAKGWTLKDAQNHMGLNSITIGSYERGYRLPPVDILKRMAIHYEVTMGWLFNEPMVSRETLEELDSQIQALKEAYNG